MTKSHAGTNERNWERSLRCVEMFAHIAREAWHVEQRPPGALIDPDLAERTERQLLQLETKLAFPG